MSLTEPEVTEQQCSIEAKKELARALFTEKPVQDRATWEDIQGEVEALVGIQNDIKSTFKQIDKDCDNINLHGKPLSTQVEIIENLIDEQKGIISGLEEEKAELEEEKAELEQQDTYDTQAILDLFSDLGFDTTCLKNPQDPSKLVDITEHSVVDSLKNQLQRMKP